MTQLKKRSRSLGSRFATGLNFKKIVDRVPREKTLTALLPKTSGRDNLGHVSARHIGGRHKRFYRAVDFKRAKTGVLGHVLSVEYDPNRNTTIALVNYADGHKGYILATQGLRPADVVTAGPNAEIRSGNALPIVNLPVGTIVSNVELNPGRGGVLVRGAGTGAKILAKDQNYVTIKLPSGETRLVNSLCTATVGPVANAEVKTITLGSAGRARHQGRRPHVRGTAQNPRTHPHGGGEGRSGEGLKQAKTPWGKPARGLKTRRKGKYSDKYILERKENKH